MHMVSLKSLKKKTIATGVSPGLRQTRSRPSGELRLILVSSEDKTRFQSSTVQFTCSLAKCSLSTLCSLVSSDAIAGILLLNPPTLSLLLFVQKFLHFDLFLRLCVTSVS